MANEISVGMNLRLRNGNADESFSVAGLQFDQAAQQSVGAILQIGTAVETIALGDVASAGYAAFRNLSTATSGTAYIAIGHYDGTTMHGVIHLRRGQPAVAPLRPTITLAAQAHGTALPLRYVVLAE